MKAFRDGVLRGMGIFVGMLVLAGLSVLSAQTYRTFQAGELISASFINDTFRYLKNRLDSPLPRTSSGSVSWSTASTTYQNVTGLTVSVSGSGSPIWVGLVSDASGSASSIGLADGTRNDCSGEVRLLRDGTEIARYSLRLYGGDTPARPYTLYFMPPGLVWHIDEPGTGSFTYTVEARRVGSSSACSTSFSNVRLSAARFNEM